MPSDRLHCVNGRTEMRRDENSVPTGLHALARRLWLDCHTRKHSMEMSRTRPKKRQFGGVICALPKFLACPLRATGFNVMMTIGVVGSRLDDVTSCVVLPGRWNVSRRRSDK